MAADPKTNKQDYEDLTSARGPQAPARDKSPEHQYAPSPGDSNNATDPAAPGGAVNIRVKGGAPGKPPHAEAPRDAPPLTGALGGVPS